MTSIFKIYLSSFCAGTKENTVLNCVTLGSNGLHLNDFLNTVSLNKCMLIHFDNCGQLCLLFYYMNYIADLVLYFVCFADPKNVIPYGLLTDRLTAGHLGLNSTSSIIMVRSLSSSLVSSKSCIYQIIRSFT